MQKKPPPPPHPCYGYLTKDEYERAKNASYGDAKHFKKLADERRRAAKGKRK